MSFKFPYTNFQELNLDWIIKKVKDLSKQIEDDSSIVSEYIDRLLAVEDKADNAEATATAADARATGANTTANSALTLATQAKQTAEIADLSTTLLGLKIGDLSSLYTTAKDTIVNAINEIWSMFHNATAVTNVTPAGTDPAVTYSNGVFTFDLPEGGDPDAVTQADLDAAIDGVEDTIDALSDRVDGLEDSIDELSEELYDKADVIIDTASGDITTFPDGTATPLLSLVVNVEPVQAGTGDPSPSNVRPISGRAGCNVYVDGKNLLDPNYRTNRPENVQFYIGTGFLVKANTTYTFSVSSASAQNQVVEIGGGQLAENYGRTSLTFTPSKDAYVYFDAYYTGGYPVPSGGTESINCQLELGSTATDYEPYTGNSYPVTWGVEMLGGAVKVVEGKRIDDRASLKTSDITWDGISALNDGTGYEVYKTNMFPSMPATCISDSFKRNTNGDAWENLHFGEFRATRYLICTVPPEANTLELAQAYLDNLDAEFVYSVAPVETEITPTPITALSGYNAVWSDAGSVDVTYRADTKGYIDKLIAQVQALALGG